MCVRNFETRKGNGVKDQQKTGGKSATLSALHASNPNWKDTGCLCQTDHNDYLADVMWEVIDNAEESFQLHNWFKTEEMERVREDD